LEAAIEHRSNEVHLISCLHSLQALICKLNSRGFVW
jgi:hypothetical protein